MKKTFGVLMVIVTVLAILGNVVMADMLPSDAFSKAPAHGNDEYVVKTKNAAVTIIAVVQLVGVTVAICILSILGIKYMRMAPEGKADVKKSLTTYIIGACILFGAAGLLQIFRSAVENMDVTSSDKEITGPASDIHEKVDIY